MTFPDHRLRAGHVTKRSAVNVKPNRWGSIRRWSLPVCTGQSRESRNHGPRSNPRRRNQPAAKGSKAVLGAVDAPARPGCEEATSERVSCDVHSTSKGKRGVGNRRLSWSVLDDSGPMKGEVQEPSLSPCLVLWARACVQQRPVSVDASSVFCVRRRGPSHLLLQPSQRFGKRPHPPQGPRTQSGSTDHAGSEPRRSFPEKIFLAAEGDDCFCGGAIVPAHRRPRDRRKVWCRDQTVKPVC